MNLDNFKLIRINKNRGWRGLAEVQILGDDDKPGRITMKHIFSFSQDVWNDLIHHNRLVVSDQDNYYIVHFTGVVKGLLPSPSQQRSVLIKDFIANIDKVTVVAKTDWGKTDAGDYISLLHYKRNKNNHTQSDWNCIGIRVTPSI